MCRCIFHTVAGFSKSKLLIGGTAGSVGQETESFDDNFTGATSSPSSSTEEWNQGKTVKTVDTD